MNGFRERANFSLIHNLPEFVRRNRRATLVFGLAALMLLLIMSITQLEKANNEPFRSPIDIFYWTFVTIFSVGYGDITVRQGLSKILAVLLIFTGVILVSLMTATFASIFTATRIREGMGLKRIEARDHIIICGYNPNLPGIIQHLLEESDRAGCRIVLINNHPEARFSELAGRFPDAILQFVYGDYTNEASLLRAGVRNAHSVVVLADSGAENMQKPDDRTLLAILAIKSLSKDIPVCAEVLDSANVPHLVRAGVDQTVAAGEFSSFFLANAVVSPGIPQVLREIMNVRNGSDLRRCPFPREYIGKSFRDAAIGFLEKDGSVLIGVITERKSFNLENILKGESGAIDTFIRRKFEEVGRSLEIETRGRLSVSINPGKGYLIGEADHAVVLTQKLEGA